MFAEKILIAIDFSSHSNLLLNCVDEFLDVGLQEIVLVHVIDIRIGEAASAISNLKAEERFKSIVEKFNSLGVKTKTFTPVGFATAEILHIAKREDVSLILIGSKGKSVLKEVILGSTVFDVMRTAKAQVLIEKYNKDEKGELINASSNKFNKILVPIDFSKCSYTIIEKVKNLKPLVEKIIFLTVLEQAESIEAADKSKEEYRKDLEKIASEFEKSDIATKIIVKEGIASKNIVEVADDEGVGSIIMGTRGRGLIGTLLIGSTSDAVVRGANKAVILVHCAS